MRKAISRLLAAILLAMLAVPGLPVGAYAVESTDSLTLEATDPAETAVTQVPDTLPEESTPQDTAEAFQETPTVPTQAAEFGVNIYITYQTVRTIDESESLVTTTVKADADGTYTLSTSAAYNIRLEPTDIASMGCCLVEGSNGFSGMTRDIPENGLEFTVYVKDSAPLTLTFTAYAAQDASAQDTSAQAGTAPAIEDGMILSESGEPMASIPEPTEPETGEPEATEPQTEEAAPAETAPAGTEAPEYDERGMPWYYQEDHSGQDAADDGCSIVSLAMVATYLTGHEYQPQELTAWFGAGAENNAARLEQASTILQLPWEKAENIDQAAEGLKQGKVAIFMVDEASPFASAQHFLVVKGITEDGRYLVNDPLRANYEKQELQAGFREGFDRSALVAGYSSAWLYDPAAVPGNPYIYTGVGNDSQNGLPGQPHDIPRLYQTDYPNQRYGIGSIADSGCGIVSIAMVASYLTGYEYQPDTLARWFGGTAENNVARLENAAEALQLPWERSENFDVSMKALEEGKIVIALLDGRGKFTTSQHFVVLRGLTQFGKVLVNDPNQDNYSKWDLAQGLEHGFDRTEILEGYSGGWIFDPADMPDTPFIYHVDEPPRQDNYPGLELTWEEQELIAKIIWVESQGECDEGQQAVAEVILNRLTSGLFGSTVSDVIYAQGQFRSVPKIPDATPWQAQYDALDRALYAPQVLEPTVYYFATQPPTANVYEKIGNHYFCYAE